MPFNGSGSFSVYTPGNPAVTGTTISSTAFNNTMNDFASGLSNTLTRDGQSPATSNLPMGNNKLTGLGNGTARTDSVNLGQVQDGGTTYLTSVSGTNTITASVSGLTAYVAGQSFRFVAAGANTGAVTININGIGAKSITKNGTNALVANDITANAVITLNYDGTQFQISTVSGTFAASGANNDITALLNSGGIQVATRTDVASATTVSLTGNPDDIRITGTTAITGFTAAAGRVVRITFAASLTLTNNANIVTQTGANIVTQAGDTCIVRATAANTVEVVSYVSAFQNTAAKSMVRLDTSNGYGSSSTQIRRFVNVRTNQGSDITYADSATLGGSFTINTAGVYAISYSDSFGAAGYFGISLSTTQPTIAIQSIATTDRACMGGTNGASQVASTGVTLYLNSGTVVRAHADSSNGTSSATDRCHFVIVRVA